MDINVEAQLNRFRTIRDPKVKPKIERNELIKKFVERLNESRRSSGFKELSAGFYAVKMAQSGIKSKWDLEWFYGYCADSKNFSSTWWWSLRSSDKPKKEVKIITRTPGKFRISDNF